MKSLFRNIRFYILAFSFLLSYLIYENVQYYIPEGILQTIRLEQLYALCSVVFLYIALAIGPLLYTFPTIPYKEYIHKSRRAIGVSAFYFGFLHSVIAFFGQLKGFKGLAFLSPSYQLAIGISAVALIILFLMTVTSVDRIIDWMTFPQWKVLHRFVYLAGLLVLIHALTLGTHLQDLSSIIALISFILLILLLSLEAKRINTWAAQYIRIPYIRVGSLLVIIVAILYLILSTSSFRLHRGHGASILAIPIARAHVLEHDRTIGAVLHISPDDNPVAGEESSFFFEFRDTAGDTFSLDACDCWLLIMRDGREVSSSALQDAHVAFTFPGRGIYTLNVTGTPRDDGAFMSFAFTYTVRVDREKQPQGTVDTSWFTQHAAHLLTGIGAGTALVLGSRIK